MQTCFIPEKRLMLCWFDLFLLFDSIVSSEFVYLQGAPTSLTAVCLGRDMAWGKASPGARTAQTFIIRKMLLSLEELPESFLQGFLCDTDQARSLLNTIPLADVSNLYL